MAFREVVEALHRVGLMVHLAICDGGSDNRKFIKMAMAQPGDTISYTKDK